MGYLLLYVQVKLELAWFLIVNRIIEHAKRTPYTHLSPGLPVTSNPDEATYMERYWLFNPYRSASEGGTRFKRLPSIRVHRIKSSDDDRAYHDHPWPFLTIILKGGYYEMRPIIKETYLEGGLVDSLGGQKRYVVNGQVATWHGPGSIILRKAEDWHRLVVPEGGEAWTLFTTGRYVQKWGFLYQDFRKIAYDTYLRMFGSK